MLTVGFWPWNCWPHIETKPSQRSNSREEKQDLQKYEYDYNVQIEVNITCAIALPVATNNITGLKIKSPTENGSPLAMIPLI